VLREKLGLTCTRCWSEWWDICVWSKLQRVR